MQDKKINNIENIPVNREEAIEFSELDFQDTEFDQLMSKRILKVLLICNNYDNFMLEEDGRIDEQIFNEYMTLGLRYPPMFIRVDSPEKAFEKLQNKDIDLVITMLNITNENAFELSKKIKSRYKKIPIVVLTPFSREITKKIGKEDLSAIDYVFCWLGNPDIMLAIIKLIEDKMNAPHDIIEMGVQAVILVEDSIRYYSSMLPILYKIFFIQSQRASIEGANNHQQNLRMRGRPKILLATNYNDAMDLFEKYQENILGVFSDVRYKIDNVIDKQAGIKLCKKIQSIDQNVPLLLLSSESHNKELAEEINVDFIGKYTKNFSFELRNFIIKNLHLGSFHFYCPAKGKVICTATNLKSFQELILKVSPECLEYHVSKNHITKWLNSRSLFLLARNFKHLTLEHFENIEDIRNFIHVAISNYRHNSGRGVITKFEQNTFDSYSIFSRIGEGYIGGKARGLAFTDLLIKKYKLRKKYDKVTITIPRTAILCTDIFDEFMEANKLYDIGTSNLSDEEILQHFVNAKLPNRIFTSLYSFISYTDNPIAIRSSSRLEDSHYQPFAGVYSTYMIPNVVTDKHFTIKLLTEAIKSVYASVFYKNSKAYMAATANVIDEEKMGVVLQDVCGTTYKDRFYPSFSGVARSINFYPIEPEKSEDGIVNIALGLGKHIVDGGKSLRFSPKFPANTLQLSTPDLTLRDTQKFFFALSLDPHKFVPSINEDVNIIKLEINDAHADNALRHIGSTYDMNSHIITDSIMYDGRKLITFANILKHNSFPLSEILIDFMKIGKMEMNNHIEVEFAVNFPPKESQEKTIFSLLQIRPIIETDQDVDINLDNIDTNKTILYSESVLGNGIYSNIKDIIYVKTQNFNFQNNFKTVELIDKLNKSFIAEDKNYVLIGPGRWGSSDPSLGIPVKWANISEARIIVESGLTNYRIDPSQGTHFFHNLTSFKVGYFTINPFLNDGLFDEDYLNNLECVYEDDIIRHVRFDKELKIEINGKTSKGVVYKNK
ncbi:MAG: PEP/pyruvate-binding domain-containing protein [Bacteroidales bacterium]|nr:PEP/pyruvate-binding domain-containing protein [Bacteroidales bacterium]MDD4215967.1 PEP/pyruvate-binding domain-containing protein [Bacteroidales bacterium]MDY0140806.1 PEP/pyruvate-binding domain-containing protein [Bacteroidales bacterium]